MSIVLKKYKHSRNQWTEIPFASDNVSFEFVVSSIELIIKDSIKIEKIENSNFYKIRFINFNLIIKSEISNYKKSNEVISSIAISFVNSKFNKEMVSKLLSSICVTALLGKTSSPLAQSELERFAQQRLLASM